MSGHPTVTAAANLGSRLKDGEEALLLRTGSANELASRLRELIASPRLALEVGARGRAFALRHLRWSDKVDALEAIYQGTIRHRLRV